MLRSLKFILQSVRYYRFFSTEVACLDLHFRSLFWQLCEWWIRVGQGWKESQQEERGANEETINKSSMVRRGHELQQKTRTGEDSLVQELS